MVTTTERRKPRPSGRGLRLFDWIYSYGLICFRYG